MKFTDISLIDLLVSLGLVITLVSSLYLGDATIANSISAGLLGYLGAKHTDKKIVDNKTKEDKGSDVDGTN